MKRILTCLVAFVAASYAGRSSAAAPESEVPRGSVSFDPTGVLLWGTSFSAEADLGPISLTAMHRWIGTGLATHLLYAEGHDFVEPLYSHGLGVRANYYLTGGLSGLHLGAGVDYALVVSEVEDYKNYAGANYLVPGLLLGYRFKLGAVFLDPSASFNQAFFIGQSTLRRKVSDPEELLHGGRANINRAHRTGGDFRLEFGFYL
jgi:hypothetical protein